MEKNLAYPIDSIRRVRLKLTWAQADLVSTKANEFQLLIAGDEESVEELRVEQAEGGLLVAQPQLGYAKELLPRRRWLQICLRIPEAWLGELDVDTVSGTIGAHAIAGEAISLSTVTASMSARSTRAKQLSLHTVSGTISGGSLTGERVNLRSVSGDITLSEAAFGTTKAFTVSGTITLGLEDGSRTLDTQSVSGAICVSTNSAVRAALHSLSGQFLLSDDVPTPSTADGTSLEISASSVSGDLAIKRRDA